MTVTVSYSSNFLYAKLEGSYLHAAKTVMSTYSHDNFHC